MDMPEENANVREIRELIGIGTARPQYFRLQGIMDVGGRCHHPSLPQVCSGNRASSLRSGLKKEA
jgi:hypothetical protein